MTVTSNIPNTNIACKHCLSFRNGDCHLCALCLQKLMICFSHPGDKLSLSSVLPYLWYFVLILSFSFIFSTCRIILSAEEICFHLLHFQTGFPVHPTSLLKATEGVLPRGKTRGMWLTMWRSHNDEFTNKQGYTCTTPRVLVAWCLKNHIPAMFSSWRRLMCPPHPS